MKAPKESHLLNAICKSCDIKCGIKTNIKTDTNDHDIIFNKE